MRFGSERASGLLELVVFMPLALLFLLGAVDIGLGFMERSALEDLVRRVTHEELLQGRERPLFRYTLTDGQTELNVENAGQALEELCDFAAREVDQIQKGASDDTFRVRVSLLEVGINAETGQEETRLAERLICQRGGLSGPNFEDEVNTTLRERQQQAISIVPSPLANPHLLQPASMRFETRAFALAVHLWAVPRSLHHQLSSSLVGTKLFKASRLSGIRSSLSLS